MFPLFIPSDLNTNLYLVQDGIVAPILKTPILSSMIPPIEPHIKDLKFRFNSTGMVRTPENKTAISILLQGLTKKKIGVRFFNEASVKGTVDERFYVMGRDHGSFHCFKTSSTNLVVKQQVDDFSLCLCNVCLAMY